MIQVLLFIPFPYDTEIYSFGFEHCKITIYLVLKLKKAHDPNITPKVCIIQ